MYMDGILDMNYVNSGKAQGGLRCKYCNKCPLGSPMYSSGCF